jgi:lipopolysaccharide transport system ATP-binding protein
MYVRLAFAVAAHLEPEILIVDEVLAVGDAEFQKKALGKMQDVSKGEGRTVIFVSHNMSAMQNLCNNGIVMVKGGIVCRDEIVNAIDFYLNKSMTVRTDQRILDRIDRTGTGIIRFKNIWFENERKEVTTTLLSGMTCYVVMEILNTTDNHLSDVKLAVGIDDSNSRRLTVLGNELTNQKIDLLPQESKVVRIRITSLPLQSDTYYFTIFSSVRDEISDWMKQAGSFFVESGDFFKTGRVIQRGQGNLLINHEFVS